MTQFKPGLKSFEDMFKASEEREQEKIKEATNKGITKLPISKLKPFDKHPFRKYSDEKMKSLSESIKEQGVIVPILVRPYKHDKYEYEIVAGHNRVQGARIAGLDEIPCNVREMDDETAVILMVDSNLQQREGILPSEKAFAYKLKLEAIKAQGKRNDLTSGQIVPKLKEAREIVGEDVGDNYKQVSRYIRLTNLNDNLLEKVDEKKMSFIPAVELSYLKKKEQESLFDILNREENFSVPLKQAKMLKGISQNGELTYEKIDKIITQKMKQPSKVIELSYKKIKDYFPSTASPKEVEDVVVKALRAWFENEQINEEGNEI
jgi:ParB family chromosome partitioning protein